MLKLFLNRSMLLVAGFKVDKYSPIDYQTMCSLIKEKFPVYNQSIVLHKDIKLLDEKGKFVGSYSPAQARKKAQNMNTDIVLMNETSNPPVCKLYNFRESILKKFFDEIVNKRNEQILKKAQSSRQLKIKTTYSQNELQIKAKQIVELAKKNLNVKVYANCVASHKEEGLEKFDYIKSLIQNKCIVERDIKVNQYVPDDLQVSIKKGKPAENKFTISIVFKSKENQFMELLGQGSQKNPDVAIEAFLKRFYKQQDTQMKYLRHRVDQAYQTMMAQHKNQLEKPKQEEITNNKLQEQKEQNSYEIRQANARILNERLKRVLSIRL